MRSPAFQAWVGARMTADQLRPWGPAEEVEALQSELDAERQLRFDAETDRDAAQAELATLRARYELLMRTRNRSRF